MDKDGIDIIYHNHFLLAFLSSQELREQKLNEEGIKRLYQSLAKKIDNFTKNQWEILNKLPKLRLTVYNNRLVTMGVALPPIRDTSNTQIKFSRLQMTSSPASPPCPSFSS